MNFPRVTGPTQNQTQGISLDNLTRQENLDSLFESLLASGIEVQGHSGQVGPSQGNDISMMTTQTRLRPVITRDVTYTTRITFEPVEEVQVNNNQQNYHSSTTQRGPETHSNLVYDRTPLNIGHSELNSNGGSFNASMNNNSQAFETPRGNDVFEPVRLSEQGFSFPTISTKFPQEGREQSRQPKHMADTKTDFTFSGGINLEKRKRDIPFDDDMIHDAVPVSYVLPTEEVRLDRNHPKNKGKDVTYTTKITFEPVEEVQVSNNQQNYYSSTPQRGPETHSNLVYDATPLNIGHSELNSNGGSFNGSMNNNSQAFEAPRRNDIFEPVTLSEQGFSFPTIPTKFPQEGREQSRRPRHMANMKTDFSISGGINSEKRKRELPFDDDMIHDAVPVSYVLPTEEVSLGRNHPKNKGKIIDAVPVSYVLPTEVDGLDANLSKSKGKSPMKWEEARVNETNGQKDDWRNLPPVFHAANDGLSPEIMNEAPLKFIGPDDEESSVFRKEVMKRLGRRKGAIERRLDEFEEIENLQRCWLTEARLRVSGHVDIFFHFRTHNIRCRSRHEVSNVERYGILPRGCMSTLVRRGTPLTVESFGSCMVSRTGKSVITIAGTRNANSDTPPQYRKSRITKLKSKSSRKRKSTLSPDNNADTLHFDIEDFPISLLSFPSLINEELERGKSSRKKKRNENTSENSGVKAEKDDMVASSSKSKPETEPSNAEGNLHDVPIDYKF